ncbi:uncharacterized protein LOC112590458 [Harpegnathos saltator]|uniref:uncharacterized protein LOC112590458 n=1 Tax=Harpegnathos saltator TaxID=610380 RepID=UPI000DBECF38|nr:uncharacterized protein LOC112590458 [Harpegnathos saltator]
MRDAQGNVVTEAKYLRTRLFKSAVPTIFYEFSSTTLVSKDEDLQEEKLGVDAASNGSLNSDVHCTLSKSIEITLPIPQSVDVTSKYYHALLYSTNSNSNPAIDSYCMQPFHDAIFVIAIILYTLLQPMILTSFCSLKARMSIQRI